MDKNNKNNDLDNLNLKNHLNASFDMDNIKVSEDLIARTLKAIKDTQPPEETSEENKIKRIPKRKVFPVRRLVGAAAVVLVLFAGIQVMQGNFTGSRKDGGAAGTGQESQMAADNTAMQGYGAKEDGNETDGNTDRKAGTSFDMAADSEADTQITAEKNELKMYSKESSGEVSPSTETESSTLDRGGIRFSEVYPVVFDGIKSLTVTKKDDSRISAVKAPEKTGELYTLLDGYFLTADTDSADQNTQWHYSAKIITEDNLEYTILFGDELEILSNEKGKETPAVYRVDDMDGLRKQMEHFFSELK